MTGQRANVSDFVVTPESRGQEEEEEEAIVQILMRADIVPGHAVMGGDRSCMCAWEVALVGKRTCAGGEA